MDKGQKDTERVLKDIEDRINEEYAAAISDIEDELTDYFQRYKKKDETWRKWVEEGTRTQKEYEEWRTGQLAVGRRWEQQKEMLAHELANANEMAKSITRGELPQIFADNFNFSTEQVEKDAKINTSFTRYSKDSVVRLISEDPDVLPAAGKKVSKQIAEGKAVAWNKKQLQSVMIQGIIQGDSIPKLATRLATTVGDKDRKAAIRNARTMATGAQNAGRVNAYKRAQDKGVDLEQMWVATMDNRTRHSHRWIDGEVRPVGEAFSNGCEYPADPKGDPAEIYNCRCTLRGVVKGLERRAYKYRDTSAIEENSYDEWRKGNSKSRDIQAQEKTGEAIRQHEIGIYSGRIKNQGNSRPQNTTGEASRNEFVNPKSYKKVANSSNRQLDTYGLRESMWNGKIYVNKKFGTDFAQIDKDYGIEIANKSTQGTIIHELIHLRSYVHSPKGSYPDFRNIEEGAVQLLTEEICKQNSYAYAKTYQPYVEALKTIRGSLPQYESDIDFAIDLVNHDMTTRYGWLYNECAKVGLTEKLEKAFDVLSGGGLGL